MKKITFLSVGLLLSSYLFAQPAEDSVRAAVNMLFTAMKTANAIMLQQSFADSGVLQTIVKSPDGKVIVRNESIKDFADFVSREQQGNADERITFGSIKIDDDLASVWTPYQFYYKGKFSHCGVNSFQMVRVNGVWKIQYIIDTRRKTGCLP
jgi:hypothetical protein